jgi:predicted phosphodiesterase
MKIGFVSDIHEDVKRLEEALFLLDSNHCDEIVCLGDIVGYSVPYYGYLKSRNSHATIELIKNHCSVVVVGNHDLFAIRKLPKHNAGIQYLKNWYRVDYATRKRYAETANVQVYLYEENELSALLTEEDAQFIRSLPEYVVKEFDGMNLFFSHYAYPDFVGNTTFEPSKPEEVSEHFRFMKQNKTILGFSGHDHCEGVMKFTHETVEHRSFGITRLDAKTSTWIHGPCVANGTFANGVMIFDTTNYCVETIELHTNKHEKQAWRSL